MRRRAFLAAAAAMGVSHAAWTQRAPDPGTGANAQQSQEKPRVVVLHPASVEESAIYKHLAATYWTELSEEAIEEMCLMYEGGQNG